MIVGLPGLVLVVGLTVFCARLAPGLHARSRSRATERMMARRLTSAVRRQNAHIAVAALRVRRYDDIQPPQSVTARAELLHRIEKIQVAGVGLLRTPRETSSLDVKATTEQLVRRGVEAGLTPLDARP